MSRDLFQRAAARLARRRAGQTDVAVVYSRPSVGGADPVASVALTATVGRTEFQVDDGSGAAVSWQSRDFLIAAAALVLEGGEGQPTLPRAGDRIRETAGDAVVVYEVMAPGDEPVWRYSDPFRGTLRIHSKQISVEVGE